MKPDYRLISVCKLAALDIVFHGPKLVLVEFTLSLGITAFLGLWILYQAVVSVTSFSNIILGLAFLGIGSNYLPLLLHAIRMARQGTAKAEVTFELDNPESSQRMYGIQSTIFILIPFALFILAIIQGFAQPQR